MNARGFTLNPFELSMSVTVLRGTRMFVWSLDVELDFQRVSFPFETNAQSTASCT